MERPARKSLIRLPLGRPRADCARYARAAKGVGDARAFRSYRTREDDEQHGTELETERPHHTIMTQTQTTLTGDTAEDQDDPDDEPTNTTATTTTNDREAPSTRLYLAPKEQRGGEGCCPWCLASPDTFEHHDDGTVGCGYCDAAIPIGMNWYERGEKITV